MDSIAPTTGENVSDLPAWYCLRSQPKHEHIAAVYLRKHIGIEAFAPRIRFQRLRQQRKTWATEALFPGYLFARFNLTELWRAVQYAHAVRGILHFGKKYAPVPAAIIEHLRELIGPDELAVVQAQTPEPGQQVVIAEGPFRGMQTVITSYLPAKERIKVLLHIMGQDMEVEMTTAGVSPVQTHLPLKSKFGLRDGQSSRA